MSCFIKLKTNYSVLNFDLSSHQVLNSYDNMCEIFLLLPPETVYKLIVVSKRWLEIITSRIFRHTYITKWKPNFQLIGFFMCNSMYLGKRIDGVRQPPPEPSRPLLSTSNFGDVIESSGVMKKLGYYIDSSNDGLLLFGRHPNTYYLWQPNTCSYHHIPSHKVHFNEVCMSLITEVCTEKGFNYKVIRAECVFFAVRTTKVRVEVYSSINTTWSYFELTCSEPISLCAWTPGKVIKGVVYWHATGDKLAIYDSNNEEKFISLINLPKLFDYHQRILGESADGCLQYGWSDGFMMLWKLVKVGDVFRWNVLYKIRLLNRWMRNPAEGDRFSKETQLLAFVNQKPDSVYVRCDSHIFIYDTKTQRVEEEVLYRGGGGSSIVWEHSKVFPLILQPWPSSPSLFKTIH